MHAWIHSLIGVCVCFQIGEKRALRTKVSTATDAAAFDSWRPTALPSLDSAHFEICPSRAFSLLFFFFFSLVVLALSSLSQAAASIRPAQA